MSTPPDLSIVIVNWNGEGILRDCLRSIEDTAGTERHEVIVVDNASSDGSVAMVESAFPWVRLIRNTENRGFAAGNNQGLVAATGRYLLLLNTDTVVLGDALEASVVYLDAHTEVGAFGCRVLNPDRSMQPTCFRFPSIVNLALWATGLTALPGAFFGRQTYRGWRRDSERDVDVVTGCYLVVRREAYERVGALDEQFFFFGEETDWCRSIERAGWSVRFAPVGEIVHIGNVSGKKHSHRRDFMLAQAYVRLHRKHSGRLAGWAAGWLAFGYWLTRWAVYSARLVFVSDPDLRERRDRFGRIVRGYGEVWEMARAPTPEWDAVGSGEHTTESAAGAA